MVQELRKRAAAVRASSAGETTWVGRRPGQTGNYWEVGVGPNRPAVSDAGVWSWDTPVKGDSLQGWWPLRIAYTATGGQTRPDFIRPRWAIDIGNTANYVINQGADHNRTFGVVGFGDQRAARSGVPHPARPREL